VILRRRAGLVQGVDHLFSFPNPVNEVAARVVAGGVLVMSVFAIGFQEQWLLLPLAYGFWARVATGPKLSPLALLSTRVVAPRLGAARLVAGPPKRFAQAIGVVLSSLALIAWFGFSNPIATWTFVGLLCVGASLEALFGICLGCRIFAVLMKRGVIPDEVCAACSDLSLRSS
jgi:Domain of unknown function (DUF4395)